MDNEIDSNITTDGKTDKVPPDLTAKVQAELNKIKAAKRAARPPKPLVEGINAPKSTNDVVFVNPSLTVQEKKLISEIGPKEPGPKVSEAPEVEEAQPPKRIESQLLPDSVINRVNKKPSRAKKWIIILILLLALGFGGYKLQNWYVNKANKTKQANNNTNKKPAPQPVVKPTPTPSVASSTPVVATSTPTQASTTPVTQVKRVKINSTPTGWLNFREGPSLNDKIITQVHPGEIYPYTEVKSGWYKITLTDGRTGWVFGQYVTTQ